MITFTGLNLECVAHCNLFHRIYFSVLCYFLPLRSTLSPRGLVASAEQPGVGIVSNLSSVALLTPTEVACRGERVRDFYQRQQGYAACQTQEKVSRLECRGSCPGGTEGQGTCCTPLRSKRRKYTFQCTDGSSFVQEVEKVVKCGCTKCSS